MSTFSLISFVKPAFITDDTSIKYAATIKVRAKSIAMNDSKLFDIYVASDCMVVRFGDEPAQYIAMEGTETRQLTAIVLEVVALGGKPAKWTAPLIKERLAVSDSWVTRGLVAIFNLQTADEQNSGITAENNGVGFNGVDSEFATSLALQFIKSKSLSPNQMVSARKIVSKYSRQLAMIANGEV